MLSATAVFALSASCSEDSLLYSFALLPFALLPFLYPSLSPLFAVRRSNFEHGLSGLMDFTEIGFGNWRKDRQGEKISVIPYPSNPRSSPPVRHPYFVSNHLHGALRFRKTQEKF
jgi:hypothetical protein